MKKTILIYFLTITILFAIEVPKSTVFDKRVVYTDFNKDDVFQIYAKNGYTTVIQFADDERILDMASGFSNGWDFQDRRNFIFIKPKAYESTFAVDEYGETVKKTTIIEPTPIEWKTNLIVLTNKREYIFNLDLNVEKNSFFKFTFNYPLEKLKKEDIKQQLAKAESEKQDIQVELNRTAVPRNWDYYMNINPESESIAPSFAYDDGLFTYLGFDNTKDMPSIFLYENEKESILNTHVKKEGNYDVLVIQKTAKQMILRSGKRIIGILNKSFGVNPLEDFKNTNSPNIERVLNGK
ncbi:P-type conjugative transfer protein VirB9 [Arcobacter defluvii]|uniref:P-type type IV conjugative transfer system translocation pore protein TrbG/VirB9 n=1 Tax=Arcobacter defluvii TaxID=873191 RepID=A0AAE7BG47_9BACT|nr:P-type conjugative transfer protein VirB9 [Arcobacter defluvii]QKF77296.1 P-type type IV conjugative transfer system translocation pore protein TrbG/VirB9 [Arcobacter defluvii]QKF77860.1 P-type type IV conjugative transfer system translocation pore protein TrbG/VirB9 [Arcobacter defluvii]RXI29651.1 P-type conjugative transfer protein VirB9 [Arcobacter defluvii]